MKTDKQILEFLQSDTHDSLGIATTDLLCRLPYELARPYINSEITEEQFKEYKKEKDRESIVKEMKEYMPFAFQKANDKRGISAMRSMLHYRNWFWLIGVDDEINFHVYEFYGKDNLVKICRFLELDPARWDDGVRENI